MATGMVPVQRHPWGPPARPSPRNDVRDKFSPDGLAWLDLGFSVETSTLWKRLRSVGSPRKTILFGSTGLVRSGELCYIMGPNGSGKSSTLDALASRVNATVGGNVWVDGLSKNAKQFRRQAKYVQQQDSFFEVLTVEETIRCAAELQVSEEEDRRTRVETVINQLGLENCRRTKVGGTFDRGCSGGQRRCVSVGVELVSDPKILLGDELTSGLDTFSSLQVMEHLRGVARSGVAILCSIHQPSQRIFDLSDKILLQSSGHTVYFGPTSCAVPYFERHGFSVPPHVSAPEFLLETINSEFGGSKDKVERLIAAWPESPENRALEVDIREWVKVYCELSTNSDNSEDEEAPTRERAPKVAKIAYTRSLIAQVGILASRNGKDALRNPAVIYVRFAMYFALCLVIGIAWLRVQARADRMQDIVSMMLPFFFFRFYLLRE